MAEIAPPQNVRAVAFAHFGVLAPPVRSLGDAATHALDTQPGALAALAGLGDVSLTQLVPVVGYTLDQQADQALDEACRVVPAASVIYETMLQATGETPAPEVVQVLLDMFGKLEAEPLHVEAVEILRDLVEAGLDIGVAVNTILPGQYVRERWMEAGLESWLKATVISAEWGWCKPHPSVFRELLQELDAKPQETLFVGWNFQEDVQGAEAAGIRSVWLQRESPQRIRQIEHSYIINDLGVLLDWFGGSL